MSEREAMELYQEAALQVDLRVSRPPEQVMAEAKHVADVLKAYVSKKQDPIIMGGKQYLDFNDWCMVARFFQVTAKVKSTQFIQYGDVVGFEATAEAIDLRDGRVISSADAMCLNDEDKWSTRTKYDWQEGPDGKKKKVKVGDVAVPLFQLRSMAQTRACAKALRIPFSWVVQLAGYAPTPAEEMTNGTKEPPLEAPSDLISDAQRKRFYAKCRSNSIPDDVVKTRLASYHCGSTKDIKKLHYDALCEWADGFGKATPQPPPAEEVNPGGDLPF